MKFRYSNRLVTPNHNDYYKKHKIIVANFLPTQPEIIIAKKKNKTDLSKAVLYKIKEGLIEFEHKKGYLEPKLTLNKLAKLLHTNSNYLSKAVKRLKNCFFCTYINTLRINYIIEEIKQNPTLRLYSIKAIAAEAGYSNTESFSTAFRKQTNQYPSLFIKELENKQSSSKFLWGKPTEHFKETRF